MQFTDTQDATPSDTQAHRDRTRQAARLRPGCARVVVIALPAPGRLLRRLIRPPSPWSARYGWTTVIVLTVAGFRAALQLSVAPFLFFFPALMLVGLRFGLGAGLYAVGLSSLVAAFLFIGTPYDLVLTAEEWVAVGLYAATSFCVVAVCAALREAMTRLHAVNTRLEHQVATRTADRDRLWQLSTDIMLVARLDGVIAAANPAWAETLGWSEAELVGAPLLPLLHPEDVEAARDAARAARRHGRSPRFVNRVRHRDGSHRWITWSAVADRDLIVAVGRDSTEDKQKADALQDMEQQLRQSQKMEAVGQLTGGLAHDFNNLLTGISGSLELLGTRVAQGRLTDVQRYITAAQGEAKRAAALTHRLLAFSRRQTLTPAPTDVNRLVAGMEELIRRTAGGRIALDVAAADGLWPALIDGGQLENALLNLCINARDAMPDGGTITVETANRMLGRRAAAERELPPGEYLTLCVSDTGTGMTPEVITKAFDPFFTTKPAGKGTGLGLSMIYGFTRQSGGATRIYSEPGEGTTVCLYLPRHQGEIAPSDAAPTAGPGLPQARTVLVVDDEPTVRMLMRDVLEDMGFTALEAGTGAAGLDVLRSDPAVDLLVTDVGLPGGMNGRELAQAARALRPGLPVLFITGYAENARHGHFILEPGMSVMTKPFTLDAMAARVRTMAGSGEAEGGEPGGG